MQISHCYKNYSPLQLVGTKHDVLKVHNRVITGAKNLNLLSTSWNCSKEFELASLESWLVVQTIWYLGIQLFDASNKEDDF